MSTCAKKEQRGDKGKQQETKKLTLINIKDEEKQRRIIKQWARMSTCAAVASLAHVDMREGRGT
jgi:hypothetical protein